MNNMIWDAVLWLRKKLSKDKEDIIEAVNNIQNLFETSADATASSSDILAGKTAYNGTVLLTGSMKDRRGITVTAGATTQDDEYTYLTIPEEACFNASSKLRTKNSNLSKKKVATATKYENNNMSTTGCAVTITVPADCVKGTTVEVSESVTPFIAPNLVSAFLPSLNSTSEAFVQKEILCHNLFASSISFLNFLPVTICSLTAIIKTPFITIKKVP